jgi:prenyltransferase beta subunit
MAGLNGLERIDLERLTDFILARQKDDGCFAASPSLPSTVADTWYGVSLCRFLDEQFLYPFLARVLDRGKILSFVRGHDALMPSLPLRIIFFLAELHKFATAEWPRLQDHLLARSRSKTLACSHLFYLRQLFPHLRHRLRAWKPDRSRATCRDLYFCLKAGESGDQEMVDWIRRCQNHDGGFGFFPGTTSYMEYSDYSLSALYLLGGRPVYPDRAGDFIAYCQAGSGGFARSIRALPMLESSWHAIHALAVLSKMASPSRTFPT